MIHFLQPHHRDFGKRLIKTLKLYLWDTGIACRLLGNQGAAQLENQPLRGALFETRVVGELLKARFNCGPESSVFFWRDRLGNEIDVLIEETGGLAPVEIKAGATIASEYFRGLDQWKRLAGRGSGALWLVHGGRESYWRQGHRVVCWTDVNTLSGTLSEP